MRNKKNEYVPARDRAKLSVGDIIKLSCELNEISQVDLAKKSGIQESNLSLIIKGKRSIGKAVAEKLARALNVSPSFILFAGEVPRKGADPSGGVDTALLEKAIQTVEENKNKDTHTQLDALRVAIEFIAKAMLPVSYAKLSPLHLAKHAKRHQ